LTLDLDKLAEGANNPNKTRRKAKSKRPAEKKNSQLDTVQAVKPRRPQVEPIKLLHRHEDGYITFHSNSGDQWRGITAIKATDLDGFFPEFTEKLLCDSYYSVNAFATKTKRNSNLKRLTCCFIDLDCYKKGLTAEEVAGKIAEWEFGCDGLPVSIKVFSGRGIWLLWLLREVQNQAVEVTPENLSYYLNVQGAIKAKFQWAGADSHDPSRLTRIPGSINTKSGERVVYQINATKDGILYYTLDEIAAVFPEERYSVIDVSPFGAPAPSRKDVPEHIRKARQQGWKALQEYQLSDFRALMEMREGFSEGCRNRAALLYASFLFRAGHKFTEVVRLVTKMGQECKPPLSARRIRGAINQGKKLRKYSYRKISDWLQITFEEARKLERLPAEGASFKPSKPKPYRKQLAECRRKCIKGRIEGLGCVPTLRELAAFLDRHNLLKSIRTISNDLKVLGIQNPRARARKPVPQDQLELLQGTCSTSKAPPSPRTPLLGEGHAKSIQKDRDKVCGDRMDGKVHPQPDQREKKGLCP